MVGSHERRPGATLPQPELPPAVPRNHASEPLWSVRHHHVTWSAKFRFHES